MSFLVGAYFLDGAYFLVGGMSFLVGAYFFGGAMYFLDDTLCIIVRGHGLTRCKGGFRATRLRP